jgi:hypothetical protein
MIPHLLIARVEQGAEPDENLAQLLCYEFESDPSYPSISTQICRALVEDSIDAVAAFTALKLPGWMPWLQSYGHGVDAWLWPPRDLTGFKVTAFAPTTARAYLAAALKAFNRTLGD